MKKLIALIAGLAFGLAAHAQYSLQTTSLNGGTNNVAASTTNSVTAPVIAATRANNVAVQVNFKLTGAGTSAVVFNFDESIDNSVWKSNARTLSVTANGANVVNNFANYAVNGTGYLRLSSVENPNATAITNLVLKYSLKPGI